MADKQKLEAALKYFSEDLKYGKCSEDCPQCNAYEVAIEAIKKEIAEREIVDKSNSISIGGLITDYFGCR